MVEQDITCRINGDETVPVFIQYVVNVILKEKNIPYQFIVEDIPIYDQYLNPGKVIMVDYGLTFKKVENNG